MTIRRTLWKRLVILSMYIPMTQESYSCPYSSDNQTHSGLCMGMFIVLFLTARH